MNDRRTVYTEMVKQDGTAFEPYDTCRLRNLHPHIDDALRWASHLVLVNDMKAIYYELDTITSMMDAGCFEFGTIKQYRRRADDAIDRLKDSRSVIFKYFNRSQADNTLDAFYTFRSLIILSLFFIIILFLKL